MRNTELLEVATGNATHIKVELYYAKGGFNYFTGQFERRGLYLSVKPVSRTEHERGGVSESYVAFNGVKQHVLEMKRMSQQKLDNFVIDEAMKKQLIDHVCEKNNITLKSLEVSN